MIILKGLKDLTLMKNMLLRELPDSITVLGGVLHILQNNPFNLEICVDSWPTFTTAICHSQKQPVSSSSSSSSSGMIPNMCTVFSKNPATLRSLLLDERVVNWRKKTTFKGIPSSHSHLIRELASLNGLYITEYGGFNTFIHHNLENKDWKKKVSPLPFSVLQESHAELVDAQLPYGGSQDSLNYVRALIRHLPNRCAMDEKGQPVSWALTDELCEMRMAYTRPEYRRTGLIQSLFLDMFREKSSVGLPIYCTIHQQHQATINVVTALGFSTYPSLQNKSLIIKCEERV